MRKVLTQKCATTFALSSIASSSRSSSRTGSGSPGCSSPRARTSRRPSTGSCSPSAPAWTGGRARGSGCPSSPATTSSSRPAPARGSTSTRSACWSAASENCSACSRPRPRAPPPSVLEDLGGGIWRWQLRHPEWHPRTEFGARVGSYAVHEGGGTVLIDPLLDDTVSAELDALVAGEVVVAVTIPYHVRSAAEAVARWGGTIAGHPHVERRLPEGTPFHGDEDLPLGLVMHRVARLKERPLELPGARALAFGDRVVGIEGGARVWLQRPLTEQRRVWFRSTGAPALEHLLALDVEKLLLTHGDPVL